MISGLPPDSTLSSLESYLGEPFRLRPLHSLSVRFRRSFVQGDNALPSALKLVTESGRQYKLHAAGTPRRFEHMEKRAAQAEALGLFPCCLWRDEHAILVEFIPGKPVRFSGEDFARDLGVALAGLHALDQKPANLDRLRAGIERDLKCLQEAGLLASDRKELYTELERAMPAELVSSMDYADVKPGNFIRDAQGDLKFIDVGALRSNRPAGQYLCGSLHLRRLNREVFAGAYLNAGGLPQVIEQARYLRMLHCIWSAALYARRMEQVPYYLPFHRLGYRVLAMYLVREFRHMANGQSSDFRHI